MHPDDYEWQLKEFSRRLRQKLNEKGWNQSELARRMAPLLPNNRTGRDNISKYVRGKVLPLPHHLAAMCRVLECEPSDLLPPVPDRNGKDQSGLRYEQRNDGTVLLYVNRVFPENVAYKALTLLLTGAT
jgi:transcriptional regulator with XRE-family HTH domain